MKSSIKSNSVINAEQNLPKWYSLTFTGKEGSFPAIKSLC